MKKKNSVKFGFYLKGEKDILSTHSNIKFFTKEELNSKPIIFCSFKGLEGDSLLNYGDQIISINKKKIKNFRDFYKVKNKLRWNSKILIELLRKDKKIILPLKVKSFDNWKKKFPKLGFDIKKEGKYMVFKEISIMSTFLPKINSISKIKTGDKLISLNNLYIKTYKDLSNALETCVPNKTMKVTALNEYGLFKTSYKVISFDRFLKLNRDFCYKYWPKKAAEILVKEYEENDFYLDLKYKMKIIEKYETPSYKKTIHNFAKTAYKAGRLKLTKTGKFKKYKDKSLKFYT